MNVTVYFIGICVHIDNDPSNPRVILPDCSDGLDVASENIPAHIARLSIPEEFVAATLPATIPGLTPLDEVDSLLSWQMSGVRLGLQNGSGEPTKAETYCLPSLTQTAEEETPDVQISLNDAPAACVFRMTVGTLDTFVPQGSEAVHGKLTAGADQAVLTVTTINNQTSTITLQASTTSDPVIFVSNTGGGSDSNADFLLSYLVTTFIPDTVLTPINANCSLRQATPDEIANLQLGNNLGEGLTIGCSNSVYP